MTSSKSASPQPNSSRSSSASATSSSNVSGLNSASTSSTSISTGKSKSPPVKPPNVFSNDGSFLDRMRRSMKEEEDKKKEQEALERLVIVLGSHQDYLGYAVARSYANGLSDRKKQFSDRFKTRGKRPAPQAEPSVSNDDNTEDEASPMKKSKPNEEADNANKADEDDSAQAKYHKAVGCYNESLKDTGTGVRPLVK